MKLLKNRYKEKFSDREIITGIQNGDGYMVDLLYVQCRDSIYRYITNNNGSSLEADDVIQETIIAVFERIKNKGLELNYDTRLSTYLMAVAKNKWMKHLRSRGSMIIVPFDDQTDLLDDSDEFFLQEERFQQLKILIERLDEVCRQILRERYWLKKKFDQIKVKGCSTLEALKMKSSRCHKQLLKMHG